MRRRFMIAFAVVVALLAMLVPGMAGAAPSGAVSTTDNAGFVDTNAPLPYTDQACLNGQGVNCNIYLDKRDVWFSGLPVQASLGAGTYFFAVLSPGGQATPNDGGTNNANGALANLSDDYDLYTNRMFTVDGNGNITSYAGTHNLDGNKLQLFPYADTPNPGGVYILAVCEVPQDPTTGDGAPGANPNDCKYDAFKIQEGEVQHGQPLTISKDASGSDTRTFTWGITKDVDKTQINIAAGGTATFNYTVSVTHNSGAVSNVKVTGTITVFNPNLDAGNNAVPVDIDGVTDQLSDGTVCTVTNGGPQTLTATETHFAYTCDLSGLPEGALNNKASVSWSQQLLDNGALLDVDSANFIFNDIQFTETKVDDCVSVSDTLGGSLGTICSTDPSPKELTYSKSFDGVAGTCTDYDNTATFTTNSTGTTGSDSKTVTVCVGANLTVSKTASPAFTRTYNWSISKAVDKTLVEQIGGTATFNYTVNASETGFTDSAWVVTGKITVSNPNDWENIVANVSDAVNNGGSCSLDNAAQATVTVPASGHVDVAYTCTFSSGSSGTNTATATWNKDAFFTSDDSASGTADFAFTTPTTTVNKTITVQDTFNGGTPTTLGTLTATDATPFASATYTYAHTVNVPANNCVYYTNTAKIVETKQSASKTVEVCGPAKTGALTMGFWQNKNGQGIISAANQTNLGNWLKQFHPFSDAPSTGLATYVSNIIKAATCTSTTSTCNSMLRAQMLATALDVYFSDSVLGGNKIGAFNGNVNVKIGDVVIDLTKICQMIDGTGGTATCSGTFENVSTAFGGATSMAVMNMLLYQNIADPSADKGANWYNQVKATQVLAKDAFDAINNQVAFAP